MFLQLLIKKYIYTSPNVQKNLGDKLLNLLKIP